MTTVSAEDRAELEIMRNRGYRVVPGSTGYGSTVINPATVTSPDRYPGRPDLGTREDVSIDASTAISVPWDTPTGASAEAMQAALEKHRIRQEAKTAAAGDGELDEFEEPIVDPGGDPPGSGGDSGGDDDGDLGSPWDARQGENALVDLQNGFVSALLETGIGADLANSLWNWAKGRFISDPSFTAAQAKIEVYDQPAFKERFPAIDQMRGAGRRDVPTPHEYLQREKWLSGELTRYGMADLGANINTVITDTFVNSVGTAEIQERLAGAARVIFEAPDDVKKTFIDWYGPQGDAALMMTFLDPTDNWGGGWIEVKRNIESSEVGGMSSMILDSRVAKERARSIAALGLQQGAIWDKFATLKEQENLFIERAGETDLDLISHGSAAEFGVEGEQVGGEFLSGFELSDMLEHRRATRAADFAGGGGAMITGSTTGFGAANV